MFFNLLSVVPCIKDKRLQGITYYFGGSSQAILHVGGSAVDFEEDFEILDEVHGEVSEAWYGDCAGLNYPLLGVEDEVGHSLVRNIRGHNE
jgi:hypothetical protein